MPSEVVEVVITVPDGFVTEEEEEGDEEEGEKGRERGREGGKEFFSQI